MRSGSWQPDALRRVALLMRVQKEAARSCVVQLPNNKTDVVNVGLMEYANEKAQDERHRIKPKDER